MAHSFQDMSLDYFECNPFNTIGQDWFAITAKKGDKVNAMTAGWGGMGAMWGKSCVFVVVRKSRYTKEFMDASDRFSITFFPDKKGKGLLKYLGSVSGRDEDKLSVARVGVDYYEDVPYIDAGKIVLICRKMFCAPLEKSGFLDAEIDPKWYADGDYHDLYIAEVERFMAR